MDICPEYNMHQIYFVKSCKYILTLIQYYEYNEEFNIYEGKYVIIYNYSIKIYIHILYKLSLYYKFNILLQDWNIITSILHNLNETEYEFLYYFNLFLNVIKMNLN